MPDKAAKHQPIENTGFPEWAPASAALPPPAARALAAFIDYLVLMALLMFISSFGLNFDVEFLISFAVSLLYFGIGNSHIMGGQTLGKRALGLRVVSPLGPVSPARSILRYCATYGAPLLFAEVPPLVMRAAAVVASPLLTELHMLLVLLYFAWNFSAVLLTPYRRAVHDVLCGTLVIRGAAEDIAELPPPDPAALRRGLMQALGIGCFAAAVLWLIGANHRPAVEAIHRHRYRLENRYDVRLLSASQRADAIELHLAVQPAQSTERRELIARFAADLRENSLMRAEAAQRLEFWLYPMRMPEGPAAPEMMVYNIKMQRMEEPQAAEAEPAAILERPAKGSGDAID